MRSASAMLSSEFPSAVPDVPTMVVPRSLEAAANSSNNWSSDMEGSSFCSTSIAASEYIISVIGSHA